MPHADEPQPAIRSYRIFWILFLIVGLIGGAARVMDSSSWRQSSPDEAMYRRYVNLMDGYEGVVGVFASQEYKEKTGHGTLIPFKVKIEGTGAMAMPELAAFYIGSQRANGTQCELPPTRFLYIYTSWLWKQVQFGNQSPLSPAEMMMEPKGSDYSQDPDHRDPALASLHRVSCLFSILLMLAGGMCAWRMLGPLQGVSVLALLAFDPVHLHLSQHAMVDGFFAFWATMALWTTWECLRAPDNRRWLALHVLVLALMVMTKENAFFVYVALALVVVANHWLRFGTVTPRFLVASLMGGLLGVGALILLSGGAGNFFEIYKTLVSKAQNLEYARLTGDGPWYRYLVDLMTVNPLVLCLAIGGVFAVSGQHKELAFLGLFIAGSYLIMCNVRYAMNLRYASIWTMPLCALAVAALWHITGRFRHRHVVMAFFIVGLAAYEVRQYAVFSMNSERPLYELVPGELLREVRIIKD